MTASFASRLEAGWSVQAAIGLLFQKAGFWVLAPPVGLAASQTERSSYAGSHDFYIRAGRGRWLSVEVKGKNESFTSPLDFPYHLVTLYAATKPQPHVLILRSSTTEAVLGLLPAEAPLVAGWQRDHARGSAYQVVQAPREALLPFSELVRRIRRG